MVVKTEGRHKGEFLMSRANGDLSMEVATLTSGQKVVDGQVLSVVGGKLVAATGHLASSGLSDEVFGGIAFGNYDASATGANADTSIVVVARLAEVKANALKFNALSGGAATTAIVQQKKLLSAQFIVVR